MVDWSTISWCLFTIYKRRNRRVVTLKISSRRLTIPIKCAQSYLPKQKSNSTKQPVMNYRKQKNGLHLIYQMFLSIYRIRHSHTLKNSFFHHFIPSLASLGRHYVTFNLFSQNLQRKSASHITNASLTLLPTVIPKKELTH